MGRRLAPPSPLGRAWAWESPLGRVWAWGSPLGRRGRGRGVWPLAPAWGSALVWRWLRRGGRCGYGRWGRRGRRADAQLHVAADSLLLAVGVLDDAGEGVSSLHVRDRYRVGEAAVAQQVELDGLPFRRKLGVVKAGTDESEALRQRLDHLAEGAVVAGGDGDPQLTPGSCPDLLEGPAGAVRLRIHRAGLRQQHRDAHHGGHGHRCNCTQRGPEQFALLFADVDRQPVTPQSSA